MESISQPPASDRAHYSHYRLMMARSLQTASIHCYLGPWSGGAEHTQTALDAAHGATRNVLLPYFCWREASVFIFHKTNITSLNAVITHTVLLLQVKLMVVEFVTDMVTTMVCACQCGHTEVCTLIRGLLETQSSNQRGRSLKEPP